jgi:hypothetical protein
MGWGQLAMLGGGLVSSGIDAFRGSSKAEKSYEKYLKSKGISEGEKRKQLSNASGILADKADLAKQNVVGNLQGQGLGNSIIGTQAGLKADVEKNKAIIAKSNSIDDKSAEIERDRKRKLMEFKLQKDQARRQGASDFFSGALKGGGTMLTDWMNPKPPTSSQPDAKKLPDHEHN